LALQLPGYIYDANIVHVERARTSLDIDRANES
jgi:hypothetical protein